MTISDKDKLIRESQARALGGFRALDTYTEARFKRTKANSEALDAAIAFDTITENLYLCGPTGTGKSHLSAIAVRKSIEKPDRIVTVTQMALARAVRSCHSAEQEDSLIRRFVRIPTLVIDDLGAGKDTEWSLSLIYEVIHGRYMNTRGGLIVTSNLTLGQIAEKTGDDRVSSRLAQMCKVFNLTNETDHRIGGV